MRIFRAEKIKDNSIYLYKDDVHHILTVLHKKNNDIIFCNFETTLYECKIVNTRPFILEILSTKTCKLKPYNLNIYMAVIDKKNFEMITRSLNELNCLSITPVYFERSQRNIVLDQDRLERIVVESNKQCSRVEGLKVNQPISFNEMLKLVSQNNKQWFMAYENEEKTFVNISLTHNDINVIIGPEGGFTITEAESLISANVQSIKLTNTILRAETAATYIASILIEKIKEANNEQ